MAQRVNALDWEAIAEGLDGYGCATIRSLITAPECDAIAALYSRDEIFRSRVVMARHGFGRGEYKYFDYPLPDIIGGLRTALYPHSVPVANRWNEAMRIDVRYPAEHAEFIQRCHDAGQLRPTPLMLEYARAITTACIRISTENMCSRFRSQFCFPSRTATSPVANSS
jgi:hypothetical protein